MTSRRSFQAGRAAPPTWVVLTAIVFLLAAGCGGGHEVTSDVLSGEGIEHMLVFAPAKEGQWPVVFALHGLRGKAEDMTEIGTRLADEGLVVFAPSYRTDVSSEQGVADTVSDITCGYRLATESAAEYGGDLDKPLTVVGWSFGATNVLAGGLSPDDPAIACSVEVPVPDVVVAISGCHYEFEGSTFDFDPSGWGNKEAQVVLMAGDEDTVCPAWQSEDATEALRSAGYDVDLVTLKGAVHYSPIFHDLVDDEWILVPDDPAGAQTVDVIVDAINEAAAA